MRHRRENSGVRNRREWPTAGAAAVTLPIFVVNLDRRPDRWRSIAENLDRVGVLPVRIPAVDGRDIEEPPAPPRKVRSPLHPPRTAFEIACGLSHRKAMAGFLATDAPACLILEDDAEVASDVAAMLRTDEWWPRGINVLKLDTHAGRRLYGQECGRTPSGRLLRRNLRWHPGAAGYMVNRPAAQALIDAPECSELQIDVALFDFRVSGIARSLGSATVFPAMVRQRTEKFGTDIGRDRETRRGEWRGEWRRERRHARIGRALGKAPHAIRMRLLRITGKARYALPEYRDAPDGRHD